MALLKIGDEISYEPIGGEVRYYGGRCGLFKEEDRWKLMSLYVPGDVRRKGIGSALVGWCCNYVKVLDEPLWLYAGPFGYQGPNRKQLIKWYRSFGFVSEFPNEPWRSLWFNHPTFKEERD